MADVDRGFGGDMSPGGNGLGHFRSGRFVDEKAAAIQNELNRRPEFNIRHRIALGFLLSFIFTCIIVIAAMVFISNLGNRQQFLARAGNFEYEIMQARRFEKNYFLYGANLHDALYHVQNAWSLISLFKEEMRQLLGDGAHEDLLNNLSIYKDSMEKLLTLEGRTDSMAISERHQIEPELRRASAKIVTNALIAINNERDRVQTLVKTSMLIALVGLLGILVLEVAMATFIAGHIIRPFKRFEGYFKRIAGGDFSLIKPTRRYRDEFSSLAVAINQMLIEIKSQQEQLLQSRKMAAIGTLTAGIAHELNNPLNNISITIEALLDGFEDCDKSQQLKMLEDISAQLERACVTVKNLLDFSRREKTILKKLSINDVLEKTISLIANEIVRNNIRLKLELEDNLPEIKGSRHNLQQVFLNLFLNSIQAMPEGGEIGVRSHAENQSIRIEVSDTGEGIAPEHLDVIFDPFFTTKGIGKGTGLGLYVSYRIIDDHGGSITAKSKIGKGTTFSITLPVWGDKKAPEKSSTEI